MESTIQTKGVSLINVSAVTMSSVDQRILSDIQASSLDVVLNKAAHNEAVGKDYFYRAAVHYALGKGFSSLPADERGKFPSLSDTIKTALNVVSVESTNSQRKYVGQVWGYCWKVAQEGYDPLQFPSFASLKKVAVPKKEAKISFEQDSINGEVIEQYNAGKIAEAEAKARAIAEKAEAEAEAVKAKEAESEAEAKRNEMQAQVDKVVADIASLKEALQGALYGDANTRKSLRASYPKV